MWKQLASLLILLIIVFPAVSAVSTVTVTNGVIINTQYGRLTVLNNQEYLNFTVYANATVYFVYAGIEKGSFVFTSQSYGNGTLQLRFKGLQPTQVTQSAATSSYSIGSQWQQLTYTASQTSPLVLVFGVGPSFPGFGGLGLAFVIGFILILLFIIVSQVTRKAKDEEREFRKFIDKGPAGNQPSTNHLI